jgi:SNF2 family DNA or RNA helicase
MFLDQRILGHRYLSSFRSRYCIMGGWEGRQIIGQRNTEEFYSLIAPHSYRLTKAEALDLPEKIYVTREYEMSETTHKAYKEMKDTLMVQFNDGTIADAQNAAVAMLRLQQIVCGSLPNEEGETKETGKERIEELLEIVRQVEGPVVVWARFIDNIKVIAAALQDEGLVVTYYGATSAEQRAEAVNSFCSGQARFFVSNPAAGGVGLNLQSSGCQTVVYYSNSFNYVERMQSEDRLHRIGTRGAVTYFDIVARKSVDRAILRSLRNKRDIATLTLDEIRMAVKEDA